MFVPYSTAGFVPAKTKALTPNVVPTNGLIPVTRARLAWAAATVGAPAPGLGIRRRPAMELTWRIATVFSTLQRDAAARRWVKSDSYRRLDPSEKSSVSYFHGMVGARLLTEHLLDVPCLIHLDAVLNMLGVPASRSRPDFVGYDPGTGQYTLTLEAKGRSGAWSPQVIADAKVQARLGPAIISTTSRIAAASLTYFDSDGYWCGHLEDPPADEQEGLIPRELAVAHYYWPIVQAVARSRSGERSDASVSGRFDESGIAVTMPLFVFDALADVDGNTKAETQRLTEAGSALITSWRRAAEAPVNHPLPKASDISLRAAGASAQTTSGRRMAIAQAITDEGLEKTWTGPDLVTVSLTDQ